MVKEDQLDAGIVFSSVAQAYDVKQVQRLSEDLTGEIVFGAAIVKGGSE